MATHPPVGAIMGNTEHHSFNFIPSSVLATRYNVIISSRSAGSSDRAVLSRHWGEMQIDFISAVAFLGPPLVTHRLPFQAKIWKSAGNVKPRRDRIKRCVLFTAIAGSQSEILLNATLSASPVWELSIMLLTRAAVFLHRTHAADRNSRLKAANWEGGEQLLGSNWFEWCLIYAGMLFKAVGCNDDELTHCNYLGWEKK